MELLYKSSFFFDDFENLNDFKKIDFWPASKKGSFINKKRAILCRRTSDLDSEHFCSCKLRVLRDFTLHGFWPKKTGVRWFQKNRFLTGFKNGSFINKKRAILSRETSDRDSEHFSSCKLRVLRDFTLHGFWPKKTGVRWFQIACFLPKITVFDDFKKIGFWQASKKGSFINKKTAILSRETSDLDTECFCRCNLRILRYFYMAAFGWK